jgi:hypothetical protein
MKDRQLICGRSIGWLGDLHRGRDAGNHPEGADTKAVEAAKQHAGATINTAWEAGQLALLGLNIFGRG